MHRFWEGFLRFFPWILRQNFHREGVKGEKGCFSENERLAYTRRRFSRLRGMKKTQKTLKKKEKKRRGFRRGKSMENGEKSMPKDSQKTQKNQKKKSKKTTEKTRRDVFEINLSKQRTGSASRRCVRNS